MSGTMRAKMRVHTVTFRGDPDNPETQRFYEANAVYDDKTEENRRFNKATPYAKLEMTVDNPAAKLVPGKEYYVDFTPCDQADAQAEWDKAEAANRQADAEAVVSAVLAPDADTEPSVSLNVTGTAVSGVNLSTPAEAAAPWAAPDTATPDVASSDVPRVVEAEIAE